VTRGDAWVLAAVVALVAWIGIRSWGHPSGGGRQWFAAPVPAAWVEIRCGDDTPQRYPLSAPRTLDIRCRIGISRIIIETGRARFISSPCSGQLCVHAGWLTHSGDMTTCLPNGVSVRLGGTDNSLPAIDAVSQ